MEPFGCIVANYFFRGQMHGFRTFCCYLHVALQSLTLLLFAMFWLISVLQNVLRSQSIGCEHVAHLYSRPGCLIGMVRAVCKYRKCSFLIGLITSLTDLIQANNRGWPDRCVKKKSTGSPTLLRSLCSPYSSVAISSTRFAHRIFCLSSLGACSQGTKLV